jgi:hypothetical protein
VPRPEEAKRVHYTYRAVFWLGSLVALVVGGWLAVEILRDAGVSRFGAVAVVILVVSALARGSYFRGALVRLAERAKRT